ncbi:hypothetical protein K2173_020655 [Erythroxylum novogranatense]|uniref:Thaumatin-like protein n=1 Tax=Erythroxylum novogranatense TaxID=1862640 RepID=A0AAV8TP22_9ROSI|nr:hypothetical protein K2173_020655 [Erythroxylum novogranatense]
MPHSLSLLFALFFIFSTIALGQNASTSSKTFTLFNNCQETIWPAITTKSDNTHGGFTLKPSQSAFYNAPTGWSGRIWARTGCNFDKNGNGTCQTGGCGTTLNCSGPSNPPNTIAEFTLGDLDYYDVSLVDGFNVPIAITPLKGKGNCSIAGCDGDLRLNCSSQLVSKSDGKVIACRSACDVFETDEFCCRGAYSDPVLCLPSNYSKSFKQVCPAASSYAFDGLSSIITCSASDYIVAFCASRNQTFCSYHDDKLVCNTSSNGSQALSQKWWILVLKVALPLIFLLQFKF